MNGKEKKVPVPNIADFIRQAHKKRALERWVKDTVYGLLGLVLLLLFWQGLGTVLFNRSGFQQFRDFMPLPAFKALGQLVVAPQFWDSVIASLRRVLVGLSFAFIFGFAWGVVRGFSKPISDITNLPMQFIRMVSPLSWMPIAIFLLPSFEHAIYFLILMAAIWPIMSNTTQGIRSVDATWIDMARIHGANKKQLIYRVMLPSAFPYILNGLRLALGIAWIILVPAEYLGINNGLGYLINDARDTLEYDRLMALVIAIGILGFLLDSIFRYLGKQFDWRQKKE